jgi:hypothetical protein
MRSPTMLTDEHLRPCGFSLAIAFAARQQQLLRGTIQEAAARMKGQLLKHDTHNVCKTALEFHTRYVTCA